MLRIETHTQLTLERFFSVELPVAAVTGDAKDGRVELLMPGHVVTTLAAILTSQVVDVYKGKTPPEIVELLSSTIATSMPDSVDYAVRITALASALVAVWELGIFGKNRFEIGSTLNHMQHVLTQLAERGPGFYRLPTNKRGSVNSETGRPA